MARILFSLFFIYSSFAKASLISDSAEYYFQKQDYAQALLLWQKELERQPDSLNAVMRVSDLKFLLEGREPAKLVLLKYLDESKGPPFAEKRARAKEKLSYFQSTFLSEDAQTQYFKGLFRAGKNDCLNAVPLFDRALTTEKENTLILREKAKCEFQSGLWANYYATLKLLANADPFDIKTVGQLLEAHSHFNKKEEIAILFQKDADFSAVFNHRLIYALALLDTGRGDQAMPIFLSLAGETKNFQLPAVIFYGIGKTLAERKDSLGEALSYFDKFTRSFPARPLLLENQWDPYHLTTRYDETIKKMKEIRDSFQIRKG